MFLMNLIPDQNVSIATSNGYHGNRTFSMIQHIQRPDVSYLIDCFDLMLEHLSGVVCVGYAFWIL